MYMVTPYMSHDLSGLLENPNVIFTEPQIKCYMLQLLEGVRYLHDVSGPCLPSLLRQPLTPFSSIEPHPTPGYERYVVRKP